MGSNPPDRENTTRLSVCSQRPVLLARSILELALWTAVFRCMFVPSERPPTERSSSRNRWRCMLSPCLTSRCHSPGLAVRRLPIMRVGHLRGHPGGTSVVAVSLAPQLGSLALTCGGRVSPVKSAAGRPTQLQVGTASSNHRQEGGRRNLREGSA